MTLREWLQHAETRLRSAEVHAPKLEAQLLAAHLVRQDRTYLLAHPELDFNVLAGEHLLQRREQGEPLAYILGKKEFFGREFGVDESVLVPRHETETLIEAALQLFPGEKNPLYSEISALDLGAGSGILGVTLKLERPSWQVTAVDISPDALTTASANARFHQAQVRFLLSDGFDSLLGESFDLILSNPPYIGRNERLPAEVRDFEPELALFAENEGLAFFQMLAKKAQNHLTEHGLLLVEIGYAQEEPVSLLFKAEGWELVHSYRDLGGVVRVLALRHEFDCRQNP